MSRAITSSQNSGNTMLPAVEFQEPLCLSVKYELSSEFLNKVNSVKGCKVHKVIELINCKMLEYWIECPKEIETLITDYAFMTWIKNPVFQKYYHGTKAFEEIAESYIQSRHKSHVDDKKEFEITCLKKENKMLRSSLTMALYHDGWAEEDGTPKPVQNKLGAPKWVLMSFGVLNQ